MADEVGRPPHEGLEVAGGRASLAAEQAEEAVLHAEREVVNERERARVERGRARERRRQAEDAAGAGQVAFAVHLGEAASAHERAAAEAGARLAHAERRAHLLRARAEELHVALHRAALGGEGRDDGAGMPVWLRAVA